MKYILLSIVMSILWLSYEVNCQSCDTLKTEYECEHNSNGSCKWWNVHGADSYCKCAANVNLDILFGVDSSGSIDIEQFQLEKRFLNVLAEQGINNGSRLGFTIFATHVNKSRDIQYWDQSVLKNYINGLYHTQGWTNTGGLLDSALEQFKDTYDRDRQQILMIITDGDPWSASRGAYSVCNYSTIIKSAGIRVVIIGVGDQLTPEKTKCLTQTDDDWIPVASFSSLNSITGSLSDVVCPISKEFKITEIKAARNEWQYRYNRFIEIYNTGIDFNTSDITLSGIVTGTGPEDIAVLQGRYLVFYDAMNIDFTPGAAITCHVCNTSCDLSGCPHAYDANWDGYCWCDNSIYIPCGNTLDGSGGYTCIFQDSAGRTDWDMIITDSNSNETIDKVEWDSETWITTDDGYSYELVETAWDNDIGDNWAQSCSPFGTPGAPPSAKCDSRCVENGCGGGNNKCNTNTGLCDCDANTGYYPQCSNPSSCTKCNKVPGIEACVVIWKKNGTDRYAEYTWTDPGRSGSTQYRLAYYDGASGVGDINTVITDGETYKRIDNYWSGNTSFGGFVQTVITQCVDVGSNQICNSYYSTETMCVVKTISPSTSPTASPSNAPTTPPSSSPTMAPTWECPNYWWTKTDICDPDRCYCDGKASICCLFDPDWSDTYDENRKHKTTDECKLDAEFERPEFREDTEKAGSSPGYLLYPGSHYFNIDISPEDYPCVMDIYWELQFTEMDCGYDAKTATECNNASLDITRSGLSIDKTSGWLKVWGENDEKNATVLLEVSRLTCKEAADTLGIILSSNDCFDNIAIYGELKIVNATSKCQPDCYDGRIYPMTIPVWYNENIPWLNVPTQERTLPAWLWWLIAALAIFLCILTALVYKYWFKNKRVGNALTTIQNNLDQEVAEEEYGWGANIPSDQVNFNNLVTGSNPNTVVDVDVNGPPETQGTQNEFVTTIDHQLLYRKEYTGNHLVFK